MRTLDDGLRQVGAAVETAAAFDAARRLGILTRLATTPRTAAELAEDLRLDPRALGRLLDALARLGLLHLDARGAFAADPVVVRCFELIAGGWAELPAVLRTGTPGTRADTVDGAGHLYPDVVAVLATWFAPAAARLAELLSPWTGTVLDVGAGAAPWSTAIAAGDHRTRVTAVDVPDVLATTRRAVDRAGLTSQFDFLAGDVFTLDLPAHDLVVVGNLCHLFDAERNRALLRTLRRGVRPGGRLAIVDVLPSADPAEQLAISRYELGLLLRSDAGQVYPFATYLGWATDAGFPALTPATLSTDPPLSLLLSGPVLGEPG